MCGEHMWEENYLFMHDLFSFIPSLDDPTKTIKQDTREFTRLLGHLRHGIAGHAPAQDASRPATLPRIRRIRETRYGNDRNLRSTGRCADGRQRLTIAVIEDNASVRKATPNAAREVKATSVGRTQIGIHRPRGVRCP